jgi:predicted NBD/HSP70 family sugar kinase
MSEIHISIDIDEKRIVVAKITPDEVLQYQQCTTPGKFSEGVKQIKKMVRTLANKEKVTRIICSASHPNAKEKTFSDQRLPTWQKQPIGQILENIFHCSVQMENQQLLEALGEALFGNMRSKKPVAYYHLGREVVAFKIQNQKPPATIPTLNPGHQLIDIGHGNSVKLSDLISEDSLEIKISKTNGLNRDKVLDDMAYSLARGLHNTCLHWDPGIIVLGGQLAKELPLNKLNEYLKNLGDGHKLPRIIKASLADLSASYGAVVLLRQKS